MTDYSSTCKFCGQIVDWTGVWVHRKTNDHDPQVGWRPMERRTRDGDWEPV